MIATRTQTGPLRYGSGFLDRTTGLRFEGHHPLERPDLWRQYLEGVEASYERYGLASLVDREDLDQGGSVSLFFVGLDPDGQVRAGLRCHGPLGTIAASQALAEMAGSPESDELRRTVEQHLPYGVIELKGAWGAVEGSGAFLAIKALARCGIYALSWLRSELALGAVADYLRDPLSACGAEMMGAAGVAYPSERYRTVLMSWRRSRAAGQSDPEQIELLRLEREQLVAGSSPSVSATDGPCDMTARRGGTGWQPVILDERERAERAIIEILRQDTAVEFFDQLDAQRSELRELRPLGGSELLDEPGCFVYFPWREALVKMVGRRAYAALRTDRNRNKITRDEQDRRRTFRVGVIGLSVGHAVAHALAMEGLCHELRLADFDRIETTNLNRIPGTVFDLGMNKAVVAARRIAELDPFMDIDVLAGGVQADNIAGFVSGLDLVIEECDSFDVKVLVREVAKEHRVPVVMATSDRGLFDVERFDLDPDRPTFHGLLPPLSAADLAGLPLAEKVPHVLSILDPEQISARGAASLVEVGTTITTWPQLGGDVLLGAATAAAALRRLGQGEPLPSGRIRVDLDDALVGAADPLVGPPAHALPGDLPDEQPLAEQLFDERTVAHADPDETVALAASRAPSGGNAQPWRFEIDGDEFRIHLAPERSSGMDVAYRGSYVAIGAALFNARVTAARQGRLGPTIVGSDQRGRGPMATLRMGDDGDDELAAFYPYLWKRSANRRLGNGLPIKPATQATLRHEVAREGGVLHLVSEPEALARCADLLGSSDRLRFLNATLHREMISELRRPGIDPLDTGIDVRTLELEPTDLATLAVIRRADVMAELARWDAGQALGNSSRGLVNSSSVLGVVTTDQATPGGFVTGGCAVERLWLAAERAGLAVQPVSPVFLYARQPEEFLSLVGDRHAAELQQLAIDFRQCVGLADAEAAVLVLRFSYAAPPTVASRRLPLDAVLTRSVH